MPRRPQEHTGGDLLETGHSWVIDRIHVLNHPVDSVRRNELAGKLAARNTKKAMTTVVLLEVIIGDDRKKGGAVLPTRGLCHRTHFAYYWGGQQPGKHKRCLRGGQQRNASFAHYSAAGIHRSLFTGRRRTAICHKDRKRPCMDVHDIGL